MLVSGSPDGLAGEPAPSSTTIRSTPPKASQASLDLSFQERPLPAHGSLDAPMAVEIPRIEEAHRLGESAAHPVEPTLA